MSDESNSDARDILSELENSEQNSNNSSQEQVISNTTQVAESKSEIDQIPDLGTNMKMNQYQKRMRKSEI